MEASTEEQLLCQRENGNRADPFAVEVTLGSSALNERYWARFLLVVLLPSTLLCSLPQPSHVGQLALRKGTRWTKDTASSEKEP